jgi:hypothetical protein
MPRQSDKTPAYKSRQWQAVENSFSTLRDRVLRASCQPPEVTEEDVFKILVPERYRVLAREAHTVLKVAGRSSVYTRTIVDGRRVDINFGFTGYSHQFRWVFPHLDPELKTDIEDTAPELASVLKGWASKRMELENKWFLHWKALDHLNDKCETPAQVRFFTPAIITFLEMAHEEEKAEKVRTFKVPRNLPTLSPSHREQLKLVTHDIAKALLTPEVRPDSMTHTSTRQVRTYIDGWTKPIPPWHGWEPSCTEALIDLDP